MNRFFIAFSILLILSPFTIWSRGIADSPEGEETLELVGRIKVKGNEPHISVFLETEEKIDYILVGSQAENLKKEHQMQFVSITAKELSPAEGKKPAEVEVISFKVIE